MQCFFQDMLVYFKVIIFIIKYSLMKVNIVIINVWPTVENGTVIQVYMFSSVILYLRYTAPSWGVEQEVQSQYPYIQ